MVTVGCLPFYAHHASSCFLVPKSMITTMARAANILKCSLKKINNHFIVYFIILLLKYKKKNCDSYHLNSFDILILYINIVKSSYSTKPSMYYQQKSYQKSYAVGGSLEIRISIKF